MPSQGVDRGLEELMGLARAVIVGVLVTASAGGAGILVTGGGGGGDLPPLGQPSCVPGAVNVTTAAAAQSNLSSGNDICITANIGNLILNGGSWESAEVEYIGTSGAGEIAGLDINGPDGLNVRVRAESLGLRSCTDITVEQSRLGGADHTDRTFQNVIEGIDTTDGCDDSVIQDNDIGWTDSDDGGNTGFGVRIYGDNDNLIVRRNKIHDVASDGIQGVGGDGVLIDRNEIGPVGQTPGSSEHSDVIQIEDWGPGTVVSNNWLHHQGYYDADGDGVDLPGDVVGGAGNIYVHGGNDGSTAILFENNLFAESEGRTETCGLGSGGTTVDNVTWRSNTFYDLGRRDDGTFPGFEWDCTSGTGNTIERNIFVDPNGAFDDSGSGRTVSNNLTGGLATYTFDGNMDCTHASCTGSPTIGFRKPSGVHW